MQKRKIIAVCRADTDNTNLVKSIPILISLTGSRSIPIPIPILGILGFSIPIPIPIPILAKTPIPQYQYQVLSVSGAEQLANSMHVYSCPDVGGDFFCYVSQIHV